jgi:hypothetical protein
MKPTRAEKQRQGEGRVVENQTEKRGKCNKKLKHKNANKKKGKN